MLRLSRIKMVKPRRQTRLENSTVSKTFELPKDLLADILSRLPVKTLLRFKLVSKKWYKLIKRPFFVKQHLAYSKQNPNPVFSSVLSTVPVRNLGGKHMFRVNFIDALDKPIDLGLPFLSSVTEVLGICDGLVCVKLCYKPSFVCICNPLLGEFRQVPGMNEDCGYFEVPREDEYNCYFGFCLNGDKGYEFFKIDYAFSSEGEVVLEGDVYSLNTNSWRKIIVKKGGFRDLESHVKPCTTFERMPVFLRGVFYWAATDFDYGYLVYFDVEGEVFDEMMCPEDCCDHLWILRDLNEELALVVYHENQDAFDIYVLNEEDMSWQVRIRLEEGYGIDEIRHNSVVDVLGCTGSGELVVEDYNHESSELILYDMDTKDVEGLPYVNASARDEIFLYTESLVSVSAGDESTESDSN